MLAKYLAATAVIAIAYASGYTVGNQQGLASAKDAQPVSAKVVATTNANVPPLRDVTIEPRESVRAPEFGGSGRKTYHVSPNPWGGFTVEEDQGDPRVSKMRRIGGG